VRYRSRDQIIGSILQSAAANKGITKTKMMYSSFLSYSQLLDYLNFMLSNGLLEYNPAERTYKPTAKGSEFLELNNRIADLLNKPNVICRWIKSRVCDFIICSFYRIQPIIQLSICPITCKELTYSYGIGRIQNSSDEWKYKDGT
jgi:predicted transcriptional regulator